jgi:hypothetical protein
MTHSERIFSALTAGSPSPLTAYPGTIPQYPVYPLITFDIVAGEDDVHLGGVAPSWQRLVQVDSWARTRLGAEQQMETAREMMFATSLFAVGAVSVSGAPTYESDTELYRASLEFSIHGEA